MAAVAYTVGCKRLSGRLSQLKKTAFHFHFALLCLLKRGKMQRNCDTRHFEYVLDFMLQNGSKECLKIRSLLPFMYAIAALPASSNQRNLFEP